MLVVVVVHGAFVLQRAAGHMQQYPCFLRKRRDNDIVAILIALAPAISSVFRDIPCSDSIPFSVSCEDALLAADLPSAKGTFPFRGIATRRFPPFFRETPGSFRPVSC
ncbi:hypothetical protein DFH06DRAFT_1167604 [Mycena polygramma]|nr:hypothetical protein DFH06DRAFT_1167604 [Mycena polygramma]